MVAPEFCLLPGFGAHALPVSGLQYMYQGFPPHYLPDWFCLHSQILSNIVVLANHLSSGSASDFCTGMFPVGFVSYPVVFLTSILALDLDFGLWMLFGEGFWMASRSSGDVY